MKKIIEKLIAIADRYEKKHQGLFAWEIPYLEEAKSKLSLEAGEEKEPLQAFMDDVHEWADNTFGKERTALAPLYHLKKEVDEAILAIQNEDHLIDFQKIRNTKKELADCFILILNATSKYGLTFNDLFETAKDKMKINKSRKWGEPDNNGVVEHIPKPKGESKACKSAEDPYSIIEGQYIKHEWRHYPDFPEPPDEKEILADKKSREEWDRYRKALEKFSYKYRLLEIKSDSIYASQKLPSKKVFEDVLDLQQYVTNLLYNAYADGKQNLKSTVFDEWVEEQVNLIQEYAEAYASQQMPSK